MLEGPLKELQGDPGYGPEAQPVAAPQSPLERFGFYLLPGDEK